MLPFHGLKTVMRHLRFKDETALRSLGLAKLVRAYDTYPIKEGNRRLYCLLPRGMPPSMAQKFETATAARNIIVLEEAGAGIHKIWPNPEALQPSPEKKGAPDPAFQGSVESTEDILQIEDE